MEPTDQHKAKAREIADDLFRNGVGTEASRLVLMVEHPNAPPLNIGGWCKSAVVDRLAQALADAAQPLPANIESYLREVQTKVSNAPKAVEDTEWKNYYEDAWDRIIPRLVGIARQQSVGRDAGLREAAEIANDYFKGAESGDLQMSAQNIRNSILARIGSAPQSSAEKLEEG